MAENYKNESMVDVAYSILKNGPLSMKFKDLYSEVLKLKEMSEEDGKKVISQFYTNLTLDGRFVDLKDNEWGLRERETYDKVHIDMNDVYSDMEEEAKENYDAEEHDESEKDALGDGDGDDDEDSNGEPSESDYLI